MENNLLLAVFVLLAASVALVPLAKALGLGTVLGYLAAGILIGPYGLGLVSDTELVRHIAEFGIVMMLFLIGLDLQPSEVWRMRHKVLGLGVTQLAVTSVIIAAALLAAGFALNVAVIIGLALSMSSTAIAMQSTQQRDITRTDAGRASLAVLLVQDVSVIPILAAIPLLAMPDAMRDEEVATAVEAIANPMDWLTPLIIIGAFVAAVLGGRFLVRPVLRFVARTGVREAFTALGLAIVFGAALLAQVEGFSPALGAFIGGVLLADSEYRHELESNLEPFKGLLLGLFFISVGMSIAFDILWSQPLRLLALVFGFVGIKIAVLFVLASFFRMHLADRLLVAILLSQAGEFAFVILQFAQNNNAIGAEDHALLAVAVALSMATTPLLLLAFDRFVAPPPRRATQGRTLQRPHRASPYRRARLWPLRPDRHPHAAQPGFRDDADRRRSGPDRPGAQVRRQGLLWRRVTARPAARGGRQPGRASRHRRWRARPHPRHRPQSAQAFPLGHRGRPRGRSRPCP